MPIRHVGIHFQLPAIRAENVGKAGGKRRLQGALHPLAATFHEGLQPCLALLVAGSFVRSGIASETEHFLVHDKVDVLGEALDELPRFRERGAAFEGEMFADAGQGEEFTQGPADPEVFFDAERLELHGILYLSVSGVALFHR